MGCTSDMIELVQAFLCIRYGSLSLAQVRSHIRSRALALGDNMCHKEAGEHHRPRQPGEERISFWEHEELLENNRGYNSLTTEKSSYT